MHLQEELLDASIYTQKVLNEMKPLNDYQKESLLKLAKENVDRLRFASVMLVSELRRNEEEYTEHNSIQMWISTAEVCLEKSKKLVEGML